MKKKKTAAVNFKNSSHPKLALPIKTELSLNESYSLPKTFMSDLPSNFHKSRGFEFEV